MKANEVEDGWRADKIIVSLGVRVRGRCAKGYDAMFMARALDMGLSKCFCATRVTSRMQQRHLKLL